MKHEPHAAQTYLHKISQRRIDPPKLTGQTPLSRAIDEAFLSYNAGRLREACRLFATKMLADDAVVGLSLSGALTPAGLGISCLVPLVEAGFLDWIVSTGANLYHDTHFALGMDLHQSRPGLDDLQLREHQVIRIYDIVFDYENLLGTDRFYRTLCRGEAFQTTMGTAEFHHLVGKYLAVREDETGHKGRSLLAAAYRAGVPIFTSSPGDSSIGMNLAALQLEGSALRIDPLRDVNQSAAIVYDAKKKGRSGVFILGGGSPKNFMLQTEPQIQEVLGLPESGHDYFLQITDARARHRRSQRGDAAGGDDVGQGRSRTATRYRDVLRGFDRGAAAHDDVRPGDASAAALAPADGSPAGIDAPTGRGISEPAR